MSASGNCLFKRGCSLGKRVGRFLSNGEGTFPGQWRGRVSWAGGRFPGKGDGAFPGHDFTRLCASGLRRNVRFGGFSEAVRKHFALISIQWSPLSSIGANLFSPIPGGRQARDTNTHCNAPAQQTKNVYSREGPVNSNAVACVLS